MRVPTPILFGVRGAGLLLLCPVMGGASADVVDPPAYRVEVERVQVEAVVHEGRRLVAGLGVSDFVVRDGDVPVTLESVSSDPVPLHVALLVDVSYSMHSALAPLRAAALDLVDHLAAEDRVSVFAFDDELRPLVRDAADRETAKAAIARIEAGGETRIFAAIDGVVAGLDAPPGDDLEAVIDGPASAGRRAALILFSDGKEGSRRRPMAVARAAAERGVVLYTVHPFDPSADATAAHTLAVLAEWTGGQTYLASAEQTLVGVFGAILDDLRSRYVLSYVPPDGPGGERRIRVRATRPGLSVRHRRSYHHGE